MNIDDYEELMGVTLQGTARDTMSAQLNRAQTLMENAVGFTLDPDLVMANLYEEVGKLEAQDWSCWYLDTNPELLPPDPVIGAYRVFDFNLHDTYTHIDPFLNLHAVKLVVGDITVVTFPPNSFRAHMNRGGLTKYIYIDKYSPFLFGLIGLWSCTCGRHRLQLAVDADWVGDETPQDLAFIMADMAVYYSQANRKVKSEALGDYHYTLSDNLSPADEAPNKAIIERYAGPFGTASRGVIL